MALHFSANQFDQEFNSRRLCNWEVPHPYQEHPRTRTGHTRIIANVRGHLLPGEPRPADGPWGQFIPTWRMPSRITREIAAELRDPRLTKKRLAAKAVVPPVEPEKQSEKPPEPDKTEETPKKFDDIKEYFDDTPCTGLPKTAPDNNHVKDLSYVPGDLTSPKHRPKNYELLRPKKTISLQEIRDAEMERHRNAAEKTRGRSPKTSPFACVYQNFEMAKKCAKENLEHHPLPDTVQDAMFRKLQMHRDREPGLALKDEPVTTGVGWKGYGASGPTQCTKMRVYRPKTSAPKKLKNIDEHRPGSCGSFDLKWRFIKQKHVTPIELAICWDMTPENPLDEPKRTPHIDGSNGSLAPAVFAMVHSPKQSSRKSCDGVNGCGTIKSNSAGSTRSGPNTPPNFESLKRPKTSSPLIPKHTASNKHNNLSTHSISTNSLYVNASPSRKPSKEIQKNNLVENRKIHQSSPNLSTISSGDWNCSKENVKVLRKPCVGCETKPNEKERGKSEFKQAFKAGKMNENSFECSLSSGSGTRSSVKVPKQRDPYAKRNYDINSLHPPFSMWKGTSCQSYPEHWRLASIYQHSYKPVENRKRSLLSSVYQ